MYFSPVIVNTAGLSRSCRPNLYFTAVWQVIRRCSRFTFLRAWGDILMSRGVWLGFQSPIKATQNATLSPTGSLCHAVGVQHTGLAIRHATSFLAKEGVHTSRTDVHLLIPIPNRIRPDQPCCNCDLSTSIELLRVSQTLLILRHTSWPMT